MNPSAMTRLELCLGLLAAIVHVAAGSDSAVASLGRIVYLPEVSLLSDHNSAPSIFNNSDLNNVATTSTEDLSLKDSKFFSSSEKYKESVASDMGLGGSFKGISFSVNAEFYRVSGSETEVVVAEVRAGRYATRSYLTKGSDLNNFPLKSDFLNDFNALPTALADPSEDHPWSPFQSFMTKWGSHIVISASTGVVYESVSSARSDKKYSQRDMTIKACVEAEGIKSQGALNACAGYSESERREASRLTTTDTKRVKGGNPETRSKLVTGLATADLLNKFLSEDKIGEQPVKYEYLSVWDFLLARYNSNSVEGRRALGLQAYYEGWRANGCPKVITAGQSNNNAQLMVPELLPGGPTGYYLCISRCHGCHAYDDDCHYDVGLACCRSYGPSTLHRPGDMGFVERRTDYYSGWCDWDNGCKYRTFEGCVCYNPDQEAGCNYRYSGQPRNVYKIIWSQHNGLRANDTEEIPASIAEA